MARNGDNPPDDATNRDPFLDAESHGGAGREERTGFVSELVRKMAVVGMGAVFMGEEGLRTLGAQLKLPKELLGAILSQAEKTKGDVGRVISEELRRFLQSEKLRDEVLNLLSGMTVEVKAEVRLVPNKKAAAGTDAEAETDEQDEEAGEPEGDESASESSRVLVSQFSARRQKRSRKDTP